MITQEMYEDVARQMSDKRFKHVLRVEQKAIELAKYYGVDEQLCRLAALYHDYAKEWSKERYEAVIAAYDMDRELLQYGSEICHGPIAAMYLKASGVFPKEVIDAIASHTIGSVEMSLVSKVLFIADYIEDGRAFPGVDKARELAFSSLDQAVVYKLQQTITFLVEKKVRIYPETISVYNSWITKEYEFEEVK